MNHDDAADERRQRQRQSLSALVDGDSNAVEAAYRAWCEDTSARADWRTYHLIGELMRSNDVPVATQREARLLSRLRERLAAEPTVLAPEARARSRAAWAAPMAVAASFIVVAGVLVVTRVAAPDGVTPGRSSLLANSAAALPAPGLQVVAAGASSAGGGAVDSTLIRSAELDRYLAAHKQYSSTSALAVPGGMVRNAAAAAPGR